MTSRTRKPPLVQTRFPSGEKGNVEARIGEAITPGYRDAIKAKVTPRGVLSLQIPYLANTLMIASIQSGSLSVKPT